MNLTVSIPDELAARLGAAEDLSRRALEAFALVEYQAGRLTRPELRRLLGFSRRYEFDGFLKAHGINKGKTLEEFERDRESLDAAEQAAEGKTLAAEFREFRRGRTLGGLDPKELIREGLR
jgi:hypothetical protein